MDLLDHQNTSRWTSEFFLVPCSTPVLALLGHFWVNIRAPCDTKRGHKMAIFPVLGKLTHMTHIMSVNTGEYLRLYSM